MTTQQALAMVGLMLLGLALVFMGPNNPREYR